MKPIQQFFLFIFCLLIISCGEKHDPEGIWESTSDNKNIIFIQETKGGIAFRKKGRNAWRTFSQMKKNFYFGKSYHDIEILSPDSLARIHKDTKEKEIYTKTKSNYQGLWVLNIQMPREKVEKFIGKPDSILHERIDKEKWYYKNNSLVVFDKNGVKNFTDNYKMQRDFNKLKRGMSMDSVKYVLGSPDKIKSDWDSFNGTGDFWHYGENIRLKTRNNKLLRIFTNNKRHDEMIARLGYAMNNMNEFKSIGSDSLQLTVLENGNKTDILEGEIYFMGEYYDIVFKGNKYWVYIHFYPAKGYKACFSRLKNKNDIDVFESDFFSIIDVKIDKKNSNLPLNKIAGSLKGSIEEKKARNTIIEGNFILQDVVFQNL